MKEIDLDNPEEVARLCQALDALAARLRAFYDLFPAGIDEGERRSRGARLFPAAPALVRRTASALAGHADLFADLPVRPEVLAARQDLADRLGRLRCHFIALLRLCGDFFLVVQDGAAQEALDVVRQVQNEGALRWGRPPRHEERQLALRLAAAAAPRRRRDARPKKKGKTP